MDILAENSLSLIYMKKLIEIQDTSFHTNISILHFSRDKREDNVPFLSSTPPSIPPKPNPSPVCHQIDRSSIQLHTSTHSPSKSVQSRHKIRLSLTGGTAPFTSLGTANIQSDIQLIRKLSTMAALQQKQKTVLPMKIQSVCFSHLQRYLSSCQLARHKTTNAVLSHVQATYLLACFRVSGAEGKDW